MPSEGIQLEQFIYFSTENSLFPACALEHNHCQKSLGLTTETNRCIQIEKLLLIAAFPIGVTIVVLNLIVVVVTLSSKLLRQHPYIILVSFLAVGDTAAGIYWIAMATVYQAIPLVEFETKRKYFCRYIGFLVVFADVVTMDIFLLLTIERYLTTVFWFKWNLRMKHVLLASLISVTSCLAFSVWRLFDDELNSFRYPLSDFEHKTYRINSIGMVIIANLVYLTTIGMYSHIFIVVRHSSRQIGTAREVRLAKRIGSLVCTNFIFLFIPFSIYIFVIATGCFAGSSAEVSVAIFVGCLGILPGMNSIMNPILYGYRNDRLKKNP